MHYFYVGIFFVLLLFSGCGGGEKSSTEQSILDKQDTIKSKTDDTILPDIILLGTDPINLNIGDTFIDLGTFAFDNIDGDISASVKVSSYVNSNIAGNYNVIYSVVDSAGNKSEITRRVIVGLNSSVLKVTNFTESQNDTNGECPAELISGLDKVSEPTRLNGSGVMNTTWDSDNYSFSSVVAGEFKITLNAEKTLSIKAGNTCNTQNIFRSEEKTLHEQSFHLDANSDVYLSIFDDEIANDYNYDLNIEFIPDNVEITNTSEDTVAPNITLLGDNPKTVYVGDNFIDEGVTAVDNIDGDISQSIKVQSYVDTKIIGNYVVLYTSKDQAGNSATKVRNVTVIKKIKNSPIDPIIDPVIDTTLPHIAPNSINIAVNTFDSSFESENSENLLDSGASFDTDIKRTGDRSINLSQTESTINIYNIPVVEGSWYVISGYMYTNALPSDVVRLYIGYTNNNTGHIFSVSYPIISTSKANAWEEFIVPVYIQKNKNVTDIKITIRNVGEPDTVIAPIGDVWIDDLSVHKVKDSSELFGFTKPSEKISFNGSKTRIDSLGNIDFKTSGQFKPYFPLIIYPSGQIEEWSRYKQQGFNTIICNNPAEAQIAVNIGLNWIWDLHGYGVNDKTANGYDRFISEYQNMKENSPHLLENLLYFYWDNEDYLVFDSLKIFSDKIKIMDVDENGDRNRPIYMHLDFTSGSKNYVNDKFQLVDLQGAYANPILYKENDVFNYGYEFKGYYDAEFANFAMFENIPNSKLPKSIFVINSPQDVHLENSIFAALTRGGRGFGFWKDGGSQPNIATRPWWDNFLNIVSKIEQLKPLLRTPHWTKWELESTLKDDEDGLVIGKRDYTGRRCMIFASRSEKNEVVTFTTPDRNIGSVYNFFDNAVIAQGNGHSVILNFTARQSGVYCWD